MVGGSFFLWYGMVVGLVVAGLLLSSNLEFPRSWLLLGLTLATVGGGTHFLVLSHPSYRFYLRKPATYFYWTAPVALALGGALFTLQLLGGPLTALGMGLTGGGVAVVIYCQFVLAEPGELPSAYARLITNLSIYLSAFLLFVALQNSGLGLLQSAILLGGVSGVLSVELFREGKTRPWREAVYAVVVMLLITEVGWALQYLSWGKIITGLVLLLSFYFLSGLIHNHLLDRLSPWVALEFLGVTAVGLWVLFNFQALGG